MKNEFTGAITGKSFDWGGSNLRPEATGYGNVYFAQHMLKTRNDSFKDKVVIISGSGNVAQFSCQKAIELGAKVVTLSDSAGYIYDKDGITKEKLDYVFYLKMKKGKLKSMPINIIAIILKVSHGMFLVILLYLVLLRMN